MLAELVSNLHPPGLNPHNRLLSPGGSSGGEGSLLASHGSVLGVGTDMGGSVRIPSAFNHLFGLKPSHGRLSYKNLANSLTGKPAVPSVAGPMSTTLENLIHFAKAVIETEGWRVDPDLINLPWRQSIFEQVRTDAASGGLCFAAFPHDGVVKPHPTISRGVDLAIDTIRQSGHKVIEWNPPSHLEGSRIYAGIVFAEVYDVHDAIRLSGEPLMSALEPLFGKDEPRQSMGMKDYYNLILRFKKYQEEYAEYWESTKTLTGTGEYSTPDLEDQSACFLLTSD
jgi:amidase